MERKDIIGVEINTIKYADAVSEVTILGKNKIPSYSNFVNVHMLIEAYKNEEFKRCVNSSYFSFPDGMPLVFSLKLLYGLAQQRIAGIDFMPDIIKECEKQKLSVFFFGSTEKVLTALKKNLINQFPELNVAGTYSPPFKEFSQSENDSYTEIINSSGANVVFVSLGCPKQEKWMARNYGKINATMLGVGAAFEIHAGNIKRAPVWMQKIGLEWLFRFIQEPGRLWKRYTYTNTLFIYLLIKRVLFRK